MVWLFIWLLLGVATQVWLSFRVARTSVGLAVLTFLLGPIGALYTLFKQHGQGETSVTTPFLANLACCTLLFASAWSVLADARGDAAAPLAGAGAATPHAAAGPAGPSTTLPSLTPTSFEPGGTGAPAAPTPVDPIETLTADLKQVGIVSTVIRMPSTAQLPKGVVSAAQIAVSNDNTAARKVAAAPAAQFSATFLRCEAAATCGGVARAYMLQDPSVRPRVLQNGSLLLLIPNERSGELGDLHGTVASAFRHLPRE